MAIHSALSAPGTATGGSQRCPSRCPQGVAPPQLLPIQSQRVPPGYHPSEKSPVPQPEGLLSEKEASDAQAVLLCGNNFHLARSDSASFCFLLEERPFRPFTNHYREKDRNQQKRRIGWLLSRVNEHPSTKAFLLVDTRKIFPHPKLMRNRQNNMALLVQNLGFVALHSGKKALCEPALREDKEEYLPVMPRGRIVYSLRVKPISKAWARMFLLKRSLPVKYRTPQ